MTERWSVGAHSIQYEPETGLVHLVHSGTMNGPEMVSMTERCVDIARTHHPGEPMYMFVDNRSASGFTADARRAMGQSPLIRTEMYVALYGASYPVRAVINMVFKAVALVSSSKSVTVAVATEADARTWLTEQRRVHRDRQVKSVA